MQRTVLRVGKRLSSTKANARAPHELPADKLRALTSIYHQTHSFITAENLDAKIDEAFARHYAERATSGFISADDLRSIKASQQRRPKIREWEKDIVTTATAAFGWSDQITRREARVIETLYGVDGSNKVHRLPGPEVLAESEGIPDEGDENGQREAMQEKSKSGR